MKALSALAGDVHATLEKEGLLFRTVTLKIRFSGFVTRTRSRSLERPSRDSGEILDVSRELFDLFPGGREIRLIGIRLSGLEEGGRSQKTLSEF